MAIPIKFSDGQSADASKITRATLFPVDDPRLLVEMGDSVIRVFGDGSEADADMLDAVRDEHHLNFLVFRHPIPKTSN